MAGSGSRRYMVSEDTEDFLNSTSVSAILGGLQGAVTGSANPDLPIEQEEDIPDRPEDLETIPEPLSPLVTAEMQQAQLDRLNMDGTQITGLLERPEPGDNVVSFPGGQQDSLTGNLAEMVDDGERVRMGERVKHTYEIDESSRNEWMEGYRKALELVDYTTQAKNYPIHGAANIKYPLLVMSSLQFAARAFPAIVKPGNMVRMRVEGLEPAPPNPAMMDPAFLQTPEGQQQFQLEMIKASKTERGNRVSKYMSWQLRTHMRSWKDETDTLLHRLPLIGCEFRKIYQDAGTGRKRAILCNAENVIINMKARSVEEAPRISELFTLYPHELETKIRSGEYIDIREAINFVPDDALDNQEPIEFIEQHCREDLDGDGYDEPVIVTIHRDSGAVARIENNYDPEDVVQGQDGSVISIQPTQIFVKYDFLPSPTGGLYGVGFGHILRDITDSINTALNQIIDAAHLQNSAGGFMAKGLRFSRSEQADQLHIAQNRYHMVNSTGADLRQQIVNFDHKGPSPVLFQVLGMLIDAGREIASVKDVLTGDTSGSANLPVGTTLAMIEQGLQVFSSIYLRIYRAMSREFEILFALNGKFLDAQEYMLVTDDPRATPQDFEQGDHDLTPVADPNAVTDMQQLGRAQFLTQYMQDPMLDRMKVYQRIFEAAKIDDYEELFASPDVAQQQMAELQMRMMAAELSDKEASAVLKRAQSVERLAEAAMHQSDADQGGADLLLKSKELEIRETEAQAKRASVNRGNNSG